jgi:hypothetical protein
MKTNQPQMRRDKHIIIEDINSTDDVDHIILENDVFIDDDNKKNDSGCCCFNKTIIKYWLDFLRHYLD